MPAPEVEFPVTDTSGGRRIFKDEAEAALNSGFLSLFNLIAAIPAGPRGERGEKGDQGERWVIGATRPYAIGLQAVAGNTVYRVFSGSGATGLFRATQTTTINAQNFPSSLESNAAWELIMVAQAGPQGPQGVQGLRGEQGASAEVREFTTDAAALAYSQANPLAICISTEGA